MDYNAPPPDDAELPAVLTDLVRLAGQADPDARRKAFEQIYELAYKVKAKAAPAIPCLVGGLADLDPAIGDSATWALRYCAPESIDPLTACLSHPVAFVRERAAHALGSIGEEARDAAAARLRPLLDDADQAVRKRAAWALGLMHDASDDTTRRLAAMMTGGTAVDAAAALHALGNIGKATFPGVLAPYRDRILAALDSPSAECRRWALYAAQSIGLDAQSWADTLVRVLRQDESDEVRSAALSSLKDIAASVDLASAVPTLVARLAEPGRETSLACEVLGAMRPRPTAALPALRELLTSEAHVLSAAATLWRIEGRAEDILPALRRAFVDDGERVCDLISEIGPAASQLIPELIEALAEENWDLQWAAADALHAIASSDAPVLRSLLAALAHPSPIVKSASSRALAAAGAAAVDPLRRLLVERADARAHWAAYALGEMGQVAAASLPELRAGMRTGVEPLASCCAIAVTRIAHDIDAVPHLVTVLQSDDPAAPRRAAATALAELGPAALNAVDALEALAADDDFEVADACAQALMAIRGAPH